jgi:3-ketosteroid 9alpha-monooxygenase subunit A
VQVPFTWKVTGWFMVGWSPEFPIGETRPLHYFGEDQVAYRDEQGELHVMEAHCKHLGAHIGHGRHQPAHPLSAGPAEQGAAIAGVSRP